MCVKDNSFPTLASKEVYRETVEKYVPEEFSDTATLFVV